MTAFPLKYDREDLNKLGNYSSGTIILVLFQNF